MQRDTPLVQMPGHLIRRFQQHATATFQNGLRSTGHDITPVQFAALTTLAQHSELDQATLAGLIAYDRATIGGVVKRLEQKGLISRTPSEKDRRAFRLALTPLGQTVLDEVSPIVSALQSDILGGLSEDEAGTLTRLMHKALQMDPAPDPR
ncbi:MarR family transcriptional regulator [uncultured Sulfitobacter sp.]|uniref:MarR family winged helix-turn-helix transcriptional regulator n=1 Tax=uncultured Sulfitobacter sp. TaxID=191468 RepID=UPI002613DF3F|nr:MarR family transcriptional regulator [uncultured Sulfitobacter sp.]